MSEKCFCHLNGYKVKDSDARHGLEVLGAEVENLKQDVNTNIETLKQDVNTDIETLKQDVNTDIETLTQGINTNIEQTVNVEKELRKEACSSLDVKIDKEINDRKNADEELKGSIEDLNYNLTSSSAFKRVNGYREKVSVSNRYLLENPSVASKTCQGAVMVDEKHLIVSFAGVSAGTTSIIKYELEAGAQPSIIGSVLDTTGLGHLNNLVYREDNNFVYGYNFEDKKLIAINPNTLSFHVAREFPDKTYLNLLYIKGRFYFQTQYNEQFDVYDVDFNYIETIKTDTPQSARQGCYSDGEFLYLLESGKCNYIFICDTNGIVLKRLFVDVPEEIESMFVWNNRLFILCNNQSTFTDFFVGTNIIPSSRNDSADYTVDALGRSTRLLEGNIITSNPYKLFVAPTYFSKIRFHIALHSGVKLGTIEFNNNFKAVTDGYINFTHVTSSGGLYVLGFKFSFEVSDERDTEGKLTISDYTMRAISFTTGNVINTSLVKGTDEGFGTTTGFKIYAVDGINAEHLTLKFPD